MSSPVTTSPHRPSVRRLRSCRPSDCATPIRRRAHSRCEIRAGSRRQVRGPQIAACPRTARCLQLGFEELRRHFHDVIERGALLLAPSSSRVEAGICESRFRCQPLHRFRKTRAVLLDEECEDVARRLAAETVIAALPILDMEGRRLLIMEGTAAPEIAPRPDWTCAGPRRRDGRQPKRSRRAHESHPGKSE